MGIHVFDIGENRSENQKTVGFVDEPLYLIPPDQSSVHAHIKRMVFPNHRFSQQGGGNGNVQPFDQPCKVVVQAETSDFCSDQYCRTLCRR